MLVETLDSLVGYGVIGPDRRPLLEIAAWAIVHGIADLILNGVFERHPALRVGVMELGVRWAAEMIERMDATVRVYTELTGGELAPLSELPSETLRRRVTFGAFSHDWPPFFVYQRSNALRPEGPSLGIEYGIVSVRLPT